MKKLAILATATLMTSTFAMIDGKNAFDRPERLCGNENETCWAYYTTTSLPTMIKDEALQNLESEGSISELLNEALGDVETTTALESYANHFEISVEAMKSITIDVAETTGLSMETLTEAVSTRN